MPERDIPGKNPPDADSSSGAPETPIFSYGKESIRLRRFAKKTLATGSQVLGPIMKKAVLEFTDTSFWIESGIGPAEKHSLAALRRAHRWGLSEEDIKQATDLALEVYGRYKQSIGIEANEQLTVSSLNTIETLRREAEEQKIRVLVNKQQIRKKLNARFQHLMRISDTELNRSVSNERIDFNSNLVFAESSESVKRKIKKRALTESQYIALENKVNQRDVEEDPYEKISDIMTIAESGGSKNLRALVKTLQDKDSLRRQAAAEALDEIGWVPASDTEEVFYNLAQDNWGAVINMGERASQTLLTIIKNAPIAEREKVIGVLDFIDWNPKEASLNQQAVYYASKKQWGSLRALGPAALPGLILLLKKDNDVLTRRTAAQLIDLDDLSIEGIKAFAGLQKDKDDIVRTYAQHAAIRISQSPFLWQKVMSQLKEIRLPMLQTLLSIHPDWADSKPSHEDFEKFMRAVSFLPPVGGKILVINKGKITGYEADRLPPTLTMEEQIDSIVRMRQQGELGDLYIHQLTVQGRLPDEFKYAALALILHSPYVNDWTQPFFEAPWGTVAPMVHDGGNTKTGLNPLWAREQGRTDFLQRIVPVREPKLEELEKLTSLERSKYPLETLVNARAEQIERDRLSLEARAYQRLALALHAKLGRVPFVISNAQKAELTQIWNMFKQRMDVLLCEYDIHKVAETTWFYETPRDVKGWTSYGLRHEGEWKPIQEALLELEATRINYPNLIERMENFLRETTKHVDQTIGLIPNT